MKEFKINEVVFDKAIYPRDKWSTATIERVTGHALECLVAVMEYGTHKKASRAINCAHYWLYENLPDREFVYFIRSMDKVKIGFSHGRRFAARAQSILTSNPHDPKLVCAFYGGVELERMFHEMFAAHRDRYEWFNAEAIMKHLEGAGND